MSLRTVLLICLLATPLATLAEPDADGCKDHPLFNRIKGYHIGECNAQDFDAYGFPVQAKGEPPYNLENVEGQMTTLTFHLNEGTKRASSLQIIRNFQNAAKASGGSVLGDFAHGTTSGGAVETDISHFGGGSRATTLKLLKGGREVWALVRADDDGPYMLTIVERESMAQEIVVNELLDKINKDGFVALYINFDSGKATIKPDSLPILDQVATMLKGAPDLKLEVAGHTDNVGKPDANIKLSADRAQSVVDALGKRGVAVARLQATGYGDTKPVADNRGEEGRAKNRRVELIKK